MDKKKFSIVIPVYQNELNLDDTIPACMNFIKQISQYDVELIFVNDGSTDRSIEVLESYYNKYPEAIKILQLSKNFGQSAATTAGLAYATGDVVGIISADMQDPIELFENMLKDWEKGIRLVIATRESRSDGFISDLFSKMFYKVINSFVVKNYPKGGFDFCIMDRVVVDQFLNVNQKTTGMLFTIFNFGYEYTLHYYERREREKGKSQYTFWKKILTFYDSMLANTYMPIRFVSALGFITSLGGFLYSLYVILTWLFNPDKDASPEGWATIVVLISIFSGFILMALGIIGEYIWRIYVEVRETEGIKYDEFGRFHLENWSEENEQGGSQ